MQAFTNDDKAIRRGVEEPALVTGRMRRGRWGQCRVSGGNGRVGAFKPW